MDSERGKALDTSSIFATIDAEISRLERARTLLKSIPSSAKKTGSRHKLSKAARAKIAATRKARWAKQKVTK